MGVVVVSSSSLSSSSLLFPQVAAVVAAATGSTDLATPALLLSETQCTTIRARRLPKTQSPAWVKTMKKMAVSTTNQHSTPKKPKMKLLVAATLTSSQMKNPKPKNPKNPKPKNPKLPNLPRKNLPRRATNRPCIGSIYGMLAHCEAIPLASSGVSSPLLPVPFNKTPHHTSMQCAMPCRV